MTSDFARHVDYIHCNPVKHGLVADPFDWRWSSIHAFARRACHCRPWLAGLVIRTERYAATDPGDPGLRCASSGLRLRHLLEADARGVVTGDERTS